MESPQTSNTKKKKIKKVKNKSEAVNDENRKEKKSKRVRRKKDLPEEGEEASIQNSEISKLNDEEINETGDSKNLEKDEPNSNISVAESGSNKSLANANKSEKDLENINEGDNYMQNISEVLWKKSWDICSERFHEKNAPLIAALDLRDTWLRIIDMEWMDEFKPKNGGIPKNIFEPDPVPLPLAFDTWARGALDILTFPRREHVMDPFLREEDSEASEASKTTTRSNTTVSERTVTPGSDKNWTISQQEKYDQDTCAKFLNLPLSTTPKNSDTSTLKSSNFTLNSSINSEYESLPEDSSTSSVNPYSFSTAKLPPVATKKEPLSVNEQSMDIILPIKERAFSSNVTEEHYKRLGLKPWDPSEYPNKNRKSLAFREYSRRSSVKLKKKSTGESSAGENRRKEKETLQYNSSNSFQDRGVDSYKSNEGPPETIFKNQKRWPDETDEEEFIDTEEGEEEEDYETTDSLRAFLQKKILSEEEGDGNVSVNSSHASSFKLASSDENISNLVKNDDSKSSVSTTRTTLTT